MTALDFCNSAENVLSCVLSELAPIMESYPYDLMARLAPGDWEELSFP